MVEHCPVCGEAVEYREEVTVEDGAALAGITVDVDELCSMDGDTRWNRICPVASPADVDGEVQLVVYRHHWESTE